MKNLILPLILFTGLLSFAQKSTEEVQTKKVITDFFEAFHKQDSVALRNLAHPSIKMQSIAEGKEGKKKLSTNEYSDFIKAIISIPADTKFEEKLHSFDITVNGPLAHVVTPYSFLVNDNLSHCGINSFTLVKEESEWKIVYLIDTRKKECCDSL
jgi:hypothetical protein